MTTTSTSTLVTAALAAAHALLEASDELCRLDSVAGDGDHGLAMASAARAVCAWLESDTPAEPAAVFAGVGERVAGVGGSMGALLSVGLEEVADVLRSAPPGPGTTARAVRAFRDALADFGGAVEGDKTVVDAAGAAADAADAAVVRGEDARGVLVAAAHGARTGADATAAMVARIGRASRLGERSRGHADAGATSLALALAAAAGTWEGTS